MTQKMRFSLTAILFLILLFLMFYTSVFAESTDAQKYYLGQTVNTGKDNGYSGKNTINEKDPHYGWTLGRFSVSGYTRDVAGDESTPIFLKTLGDTVTLSFTLEQNISKLNKNDKLSISDDFNGYDTYFGIKKTDFGKGTLIIRHTDCQNYTSEPTVYTDYLSAIKINADTVVNLFEEGDYEIALDYEIRNDPRKIFGLSIIPEYSNYRIFYRFSVRNGNCMVYPFDVNTSDELTNTSITEKGFYLDLAKSRYLDIDIKKEVLYDGADGLTEDVRFNSPAKDGDKYTDEGIYTITVSNRYTNQQTTKRIYVGTNNILKANVTTGLSINEIESLVAKGATISEDGTIKTVSNETIEAITSNTPTDDNSSAAKGETQNINHPKQNNKDTALIITKTQMIFTAGCIVVIIAIIIIVIVTVKRKKVAKRRKEEQE